MFELIKKTLSQKFSRLTTDAKFIVIAAFVFSIYIILQLLFGYFAGRDTTSRGLNFATVKQAEDVRAVRQTTRDVKTKLTLYSVMPKFAKEMLDRNLEQATKERFSKLKEVAETNPQVVLDAVLPKDMRKKAPERFAKYLEKDITTEGRVSAYYFDALDDKAGKVEYLLQNQDLNNYRIKVASSEQLLPVESAVVGTGLLIDNTIIFSDIKGQQSTQYSAALTAIPVASLQQLTEKKLAVALIKFPGSQRTFKSPTYYQGLVFNNNDSMRNFYKENSYNSLNSNSGISLTGDVLDWTTLPDISSSDPQDAYTTCHVTFWTTKAQEVLKTKISDFDSKYTNVMYVIPDAQDLCKLPSGQSISGIANFWNTSLIILDEWATAYAHEFGHNLGLGHANYLDCQNDAKDTTNQCSSVELTTCQNLSGNNPPKCSHYEYGDESSVMGRPATPQHFNGVHKSVLQWFGSEKVYQPNPGTTTVTLDAIEKDTGKYLAIKIPKVDTNEDYYISYRQPSGFDADLADTYLKGASIHILPAAGTYEGRNFYSTIILGFTSSSFFNRYALNDGEGFVDSKNSIIIKQVSHTDSSVTLEVTLGVASTPNVTAAPTSPSGISPTSGSTKAPTTTPASTPTTTSESLSVSLVPSASTLTPGQTVTMDLAVNSVTKVRGFEIHLSFKPGVIEVVDDNPVTPGVQISAGPAFPSLGPLSAYPAITSFEIENSANNAAGTLDYAIAKFGDPPFSGSSPLARITFKAKTPGTSEITLRGTPAAESGLLFSDPTGIEIPRTFTSSTITVAGSGTSGDVDDDDDSGGGAASGVSTAMSFEPTTALVLSGDTTTMEIKITKVSNLQCAQATINFDTRLAEVVDQDSGTGGVQIKPGNMLTDLIAFNMVTPEGRIFYVACELGQPSANGDGTLATITFRAKSRGLTPVTFVKPNDSIGSTMVDPNGYNIPYASLDGSLIIK